VSHELRTPLTCIKTSVELLQATEPQDADESRHELMQTIADHTARLESLVNDLLQVTRLEAGQIDPPADRPGSIPAPCCRIV